MQLIKIVKIMLKMRMLMLKVVQKEV